MDVECNEIKINCPNCGQHLIIETTQLGSELECPGCTQKFVVPPLELEKTNRMNSVGFDLAKPSNSTADSITSTDQGIESPTKTKQIIRIGRISIEFCCRATRSAFVFAWRKIFRPVICFCAASVWFFLRSFLWLIAMVWHFARKRALLPLETCIRTSRSRLFSKLLSSRLFQVCKTIWRMICLFFETVVGKPVNWIWKRIALPVDAYWKRRESRRMEQGVGMSEAHGDFRLSLGRRIAYGCVGYVMVAFIMAGVASIFDNSSSSSRYSQHIKKGNYFAPLSTSSANNQQFQPDNSQPKSQMVDMTGWPQWKKDFWVGTSSNAVYGSQIDISRLPRWRRNIWNDPERRESVPNQWHESIAYTEAALKWRKIEEQAQIAVRQQMEQQALAERSRIRSQELTARFQQQRQQVQQQQLQQQLQQQQSQARTHSGRWVTCRACGGRGYPLGVNPSMRGLQCWACKGLGKIEK